MTHGSLFSGIGGFDLAAEWMGWENVFHCEMNPFGQRVLAHHFPNSKLHEDVKTFPSSDYVKRIDILTGGFPCQPYSTAGKRLGKDDDRHLWPFMLDIIRTIQPRYVVGENVRGLVNWNDGMVFDEVQLDLEAAGYEVLPFILPAAAVGAPHRRDRVWFVAYSVSERNTPPRKGAEATREGSERTKGARGGRSGSQRFNGLSRLEGNAANAKRDGLEHGTKRGSAQGSEREARERVAGHLKAKSKDWNVTYAMRAGRRQNHREGDAEQLNQDSTRNNWKNFPTEPAICGGDDGLPSELDGITFPKWRNESIKAYGNAIVPQVAYQIFQAIQQTDGMD